MSTPQAPEPTDEQRAMAMDVEGWTPMTYDQLARAVHAGGDLDDLDSLARVDAIARALAAAVQQERDKVLAVADELQDEAEEAEQLTLGIGMSVTERIQYETEASCNYDAARRIREVSR